MTDNLGTDDEVSIIVEVDEDTETFRALSIPVAPPSTKSILDRVEELVWDLGDRGTGFVTKPAILFMSESQGIGSLEVRLNLAMLVLLGRIAVEKPGE